MGIKEMDLNEYKQAYFTFEIAINQTRLIALAASETLQDFPNRLPPEARETISTDFGLVSRALLEGLFQAVLGKKPIFDVEDNELGSSFVEPALMLAMAEAQLGKMPSQLRIDTLPFAQELVMLLGHLGAFMSDSLRAMCRKEPRLLRKKKMMAWDDILASGNWENLLDRIIEEYVYELGWKTIRDWCQFLQTEHGLLIDTPSAELDAIDEAEKLRHLVIHNGSRVNQEYIERTKRGDVKIGDIVPFTAEYTAKVGSYTKVLGSDIFIAVATKYFAATEQDLSGVVRRATSKSGGG